MGDLGRGESRVSVLEITNNWRLPLVTPVIFLQSAIKSKPHGPIAPLNCPESQFSAMPPISALLRLAQQRSRIKLLFDLAGYCSRSEIVSWSVAAQHELQRLPYFRASNHASD